MHTRMYVHKTQNTIFATLIPIYTHTQHIDTPAHD